MFWPWIRWGRSEWPGPAEGVPGVFGGRSPPKKKLIKIWKFVKKFLIWTMLCQEKFPLSRGGGLFSHHLKIWKSFLSREEVIYGGLFSDPMWMTYSGFIGYSEISILNPQTEYFDKNVNFQLLKKCCFWKCDVENWLWAKLALWIWPILWIRLQIGYTQLSLTLFHYYQPIQPIYHTFNSRKSFFKKIHDFWIKNVL